MPRNITVTIKKPKGSYKSNKKYARRNKRYKRSYFAGRKLYKQLAESNPADWGKGTAPNIERFGKDYKAANEMQRLYRNTYGYKGDGDYRSALGYMSRGIGGLAGGALGYMRGGFGGAGTGSESGWNQGARFSRYMGWGDYGPQSQNQIMGAQAQQQISVNATDNSGDIYISHTEFVGNVVASTGAGVTSTPFQITAYDLNPGLSSTFKWLSQIAQNFELYDWQGLIFQFKPTSGEFGASAVSNSLGKVITATRYGVTQTSGFSNAIEMQNYDYANSTKPSCGLLHGVETANGSQVTGDMQVVRTGPPTESRILYDLGVFYIATEGIPMAASTTAILGELWVTYRVRLSRAKLYQSVGDDISGWFATGTPIVANFGNLPVIDASSTLGMTITGSTGTSITLAFPANIFQGTFMINAWTLSAAVQNTFVFAAPTALVNCAQIADYYGGGINQARVPTAVPAAAISTTAGIMFPLNVTAPGNNVATVTLNISAAVPVGGHTLFISINQIDSDMANNSL